MAERELTVNEQVRNLNRQQQAIDRKARRLAPEGALKYAGTTDGAMLTWQSTLRAVSNAAACLEDLAEDSIIDDLIQAEKAAAAKPLAAVGLGTHSWVNDARIKFCNFTCLEHWRMRRWQIKNARQCVRQDRFNTAPRIDHTSMRGEVTEVEFLWNINDGRNRNYIKVIPFAR